MKSRYTQERLPNHGCGDTFPLRASGCITQREDSLHELKKPWIPEPDVHMQVQGLWGHQTLGSSPASASCWPCALEPLLTARSVSFPICTEGIILASKGLVCEINEEAEINK